MKRLLDRLNTRGLQKQQLSDGSEVLAVTVLLQHITYILLTY